MSYELWDARSGNRLGAFVTVDDALGVVRDMARLDGVEIVDELYLERLGEDGDTVVMTGEVLAARALRSAAI